MSEDVLDENVTATNETPQAVKTLAILSIIGSSLWGLLLLIGMFMVFAWLDAFSKFLPIADPTGAVVVLIIVFLLMIALNVMGILGALKMNKGMKSGFTMYAIATGIWALLLLLGASEILNLLSAIASVGFIVAFGMQLKNLN